MTLHEILAQTSYPVSENSFPDTETPALPFILWKQAEDRDFHADNKPFIKIRMIEVRLCNDGISADTEAQNRLEAVFVSSGIPYKLSNVAYIEAENMTESLYEIGVIW